MFLLTKAQAEVEHKRLTLEIERHDSAYYQDDAPKISDAEYDAPRLRFNAIEARFPEFVSVLDFRFAAHCGLKSDIAPCRESANRRHLYVEGGQETGGGVRCLSASEKVRPELL